MTCIKLILLIWASIVLNVHNYELPSIIRIGAIFDEKDILSRTAFEYAVKKINENSRIFPQNTKIIYQIGNESSRDSFQIGNVSSHDSYTAYRIACNQFRQGIAAIFTGYLTPALEYVGTLTSLLHIPFFISSPDRQNKVDIYNLNVYPHYSVMSMAFNDVIQYQQWDELTIIFENPQNLLYLQDLLKLAGDRRLMKVTVRQLRGKPEKWLPLLKQLQATGASKFLVDVSTDQLDKFFEQVIIFNRFSGTLLSFCININALVEYVKLNELHVRRLSCDTEEQWNVYGFAFTSFLKQ
ncbi:unnamed protein product, partial [Didymodactylos carnosus]